MTSLQIYVLINDLICLIMIMMRDSALCTDILMVRNNIKECMILTLVASVKSTVLFSRHITVATADPVTAVTYCTYTSLLLTRGADDHFLSLLRDVHDILHTCRLLKIFHDIRGESISLHVV